MRKEYVAYVDRYDYFDGLCGHEYHKSGYETLGLNPVEALKAYRKLKANDYDHGDSYQKTHNIQIMWVAEKVTGNHNFFTPQCKRLRKFPVIGWDGSVVDYIVASEQELESIDNQQELNKIGFYYSSVDKSLRSIDVEIVVPVSNEFDGIDIDNDLPF